MNAPNEAAGEIEMGWLGLSDPDLSQREITLAVAALHAEELSSSGLVEAFEKRFAASVGRAHGVSMASGTLAAMATLMAMELAPGDEVMVPAYSWHHCAHAVVLAGLRPVFCDIDYWCGCLAPAKLEEKLTPRCRAMMVCNANGHPAEWPTLQAFARQHGLRLIEDSSEAIGSKIGGQVVGSFGEVAIFDFSQPGLLCCGEGAIVVTDDALLAAELRYRRSRRRSDRRSISIGSRVPLQADISEVTAAIALGQLERLPEIIERRREVESWYHEEMQSFEGIKPPYTADGVDEVNWMLYVVHLGKRFTGSARNQIVEDMEADAIEVAPYCMPLHQEFHYQQLGYQRGQLPTTERIADRALALPFHGHLTRDQVRFIVKTLKDACTNVGAGAAIY